MPCIYIHHFQIHLLHNQAILHKIESFLHNPAFKPQRDPVHDINERVSATLLKLNSGILILC